MNEIERNLSALGAEIIQTVPETETVLYLRGNRWLIIVALVIIIIIGLYTLSHNERRMFFLPRCVLVSIGIIGLMSCFTILFMMRKTDLVYTGNQLYTIAINENTDIASVYSQYDVISNEYRIIVIRVST